MHAGLCAGADHRKPTTMSSTPLRPPVPRVRPCFFRVVSACRQPRSFRSMCRLCKQRTFRPCGAEGCVPVREGVVVLPTHQRPGPGAGGLGLSVAGDVAGEVTRRSPSVGEHGPRDALCLPWGQQPAGCASCASGARLGKRSCSRGRERGSSQAVVLRRVTRRMGSRAAAAAKLMFRPMSIRSSPSSTSSHATAALHSCHTPKWPSAFTSHASISRSPSFFHGRANPSVSRPCTHPFHHPLTLLCLFRGVCTHTGPAAQPRRISRVASLSGSDGPATLRQTACPGPPGTRGWPNIRACLCFTQPPRKVEGLTARVLPHAARVDSCVSGAGGASKVRAKARGHPFVDPRPRVAPQMYLSGRRRRPGRNRVWEGSAAWTEGTCTRHTPQQAARPSQGIESPRSSFARTRRVYDS